MCGTGAMYLNQCGSRPANSFIPTYLVGYGVILLWWCLSGVVAYIAKRDSLTKYLIGCDLVLCSFLFFWFLFGEFKHFLLSVKIVR